MERSKLLQFEIIDSLLCFSTVTVREYKIYVHDLPEVYRPVCKRLIMRPRCEHSLILVDKMLTGAMCVGWGCFNSLNTSSFIGSTVCFLQSL